MKTITYRYDLQGKTRSRTISVDADQDDDVMDHVSADLERLFGAQNNDVTNLRIEAPRSAPRPSNWSY